MAQENTGGTTTDIRLSDRNLTWVIYALYGAGLFLGFLPTLVAIIINYVKRRSVDRTWIGRHFTWQINTFWAFLGITALAIVSGFGAYALESQFLIIAAVLLALGGWVWMVYRLVVGCIRLNDGRSPYRN